jgi:hypothetical protein
MLRSSRCRAVAARLARERPAPSSQCCLPISVSVQAVQPELVASEAPCALITVSLLLQCQCLQGQYVAGQGVSLHPFVTSMLLLCSQCRVVQPVAGQERKFPFPITTLLREQAQAVCSKPLHIGASALRPSQCCCCSVSVSAGQYAAAGQVCERLAPSSPMPRPDPVAVRYCRVRLVRGLHLVTNAVAVHS